MSFLWSYARRQLFVHGVIDTRKSFSFSIIYTPILLDLVEFKKAVASMDDKYPLSHAFGYVSRFQADIAVSFFFNASSRSDPLSPSSPQLGKNSGGVRAIISGGIRPFNAECW